MKRLILFVLIPVLLYCSGTGRKPVPEKLQILRVMTFNVRLDTQKDKENNWDHRKEMVASIIRFHQPDLAGLQEPYEHQIDDLAVRLPEYAWTGFGREDGNHSGEYVPFFYRKNRLQLLESSRFWLSDTPDVPSMGWDAHYKRIVTWGKLRDIVTGKILFLFNVHFDHRGTLARKESAQLLRSRIESIAGSKSVIVTGDFNLLPSSEAYRILTASEPDIPGRVLMDTHTIAAAPHHGPVGTFTGFDIGQLNNDRKIDYVFVSPGVSVLRHGILSDTVNGRLPSDHFPVLVDVLIE